MHSKKVYRFIGKVVRPCKAPVRAIFPKIQLMLLRASRSSPRVVWNKSETSSVPLMNEWFCIWFQFNILFLLQHWNMKIFLQWNTTIKRVIIISSSFLSSSFPLLSSTRLLPLPSLCFNWWKLFLQELQTFRPHWVTIDNTNDTYPLHFFMTIWSPSVTFRIKLWVFGRYFNTNFDAVGL
mgnify:CR=1 FL=1